jgi:hypothetical protein
MRQLVSADQFMAEVSLDDATKTNDFADTVVNQCATLELYTSEIYFTVMRRAVPHVYFAPRGRG